MRLDFSESEIWSLLLFGVPPEIAHQLWAALEIYPKLKAVGELFDKAHDTTNNAEYDALVREARSRLTGLEGEIETRCYPLLNEHMSLVAMVDFLER